MIEVIVNMIGSIFTTSEGKKIDTTLPDWEYLWENVAIDPGRERELQDVIGKIRLNWPRYSAAGVEAGINPLLLACLHYRESGMRFDCVLHNGEKLPGPTKLVPKGRGPFETWEESAADAIKLVGLNRFKTLTDDVACLIAAEVWSGKGYRRKGLLSPYVWAATNWSHEKGKYVSDGKFNRNAPEKQLGVAAIISAFRSGKY